MSSGAKSLIFGNLSERMYINEMSDDKEEDKATIVLDFNKIREQLAQEDENLIDPLSLDFTAKGIDISDSDYDDVDNEQELKTILAFDFKIPYFKNKFKTSKVQLISELSELNETLRSSEDNILVFYYNSDPKVINQLVLQVKTKFPNNKILIIASNLSQDKALVHKNSKFGVDAYLSDPFEVSEFFEKIESL